MRYSGGDEGGGRVRCSGRVREEGGRVRCSAKVRVG